MSPTVRPGANGAGVREVEILPVMKTSPGRPARCHRPRGVLAVCVALAEIAVAMAREPAQAAPRAESSPKPRGFMPALTISLTLAGHVRLPRLPLGERPSGAPRWLRGSTQGVRA